jgi:hypothetical protein
LYELTNKQHYSLMGSSASTPQKNEATPAAPTEEVYPTPTGHEYDTIDKLASELPHIIDDESRQQVEDYKQACDDGKGPMVACFSTAEYLSLFERKHKEAADLYRNVCFRPKEDKSPNRMLVDGTMAYPPGCYNLGKMLMTGKGVVQYDRDEAYRLLDRACRGEHGGACYLQAQILCSRPGSLGKNIPHDPHKAMELYQKTCDQGDSISCYTLATMLLRGDRVSKSANNVSPQEARGEAPLVKRENEEDRRRVPEQDPYVIPRNPKRAEKLLEHACNTGSHITSCHNLAVMYTHGDDGVDPDPEKAEQYKKMTLAKINMFGGF